VNAERIPGGWMTLWSDLLFLTFLQIPMLVFLKIFPGTILSQSWSLLVISVTPGYFTLAALFPRRNDLDGFARLGFSIIISFAILMLLGLMLNYLPGGISIESIVAINYLYIVLCGGIAILRRSRLRAGTQLQPEWLSFHLRDRVGRIRLFSLLLAVVLAWGLLVVNILGASMSQGEYPYTDFFLLEPQRGFSETQALEIPETTEYIVLGVINHENQPMVYSVVMINGAGEYFLIRSIYLESQQQWEEIVSVEKGEGGVPTRTTFLLFREADGEAYREVYIWR
jgi:uncharacterized membrane protein